MNEAETNKSVLQHEVCDIGESTGDIFEQLQAKHIKKRIDALISNSIVGPYQSLEQALVKTFEGSKTFKLNKLLSLSAIDLGQNLKHPTEFRLEMRGLLGQPLPLGPVAESLLKQMFLDKLPSQIKLILAATPTFS